MPAHVLAELQAFLDLISQQPEKEGTYLLTFIGEETGAETLGYFALVTELVTSN